MPRRKRSIPGIQNQAYCPYNIENIANNKQKSNTTNNSSGIYRKTSHDSITELPKVVSYQNINMQSSSDMSNVYMNNTELADDPKNSSYTYVTNVNGCFEVQSDVKRDVYYEVTNDDPNYYMYNKTSEIEKETKETTKAKPGTSSIGRGMLTEEVKTDNIETDWSVYDHAKAGGAAHEVTRSDELSHQCKAKEIEGRTNLTRHSYVNVTNQTNHVTNTQETTTRNMYDHIELAVDQSSHHDVGEEYSHLKDIGGNGTTAFPHKYENVIQGDNDCLTPQTYRKDKGGYEEPVGGTPNYFMIEQ